MMPYARPNPMILGVDPGLTGALAWLDAESGRLVDVADMPVHLLPRGGKTKKELDIAQLVDILTARRPSHAFIEQVNSMPGQGVSGVFVFGKVYGAILGVVTALAIPLTPVPPATWKRQMGVTKSKDGCRARASQLLPEAAYQWPLKGHDGRAEAALIAVYGVRQLHAPSGPHPLDVPLIPSTSM